MEKITINTVVRTLAEVESDFSDKVVPLGSLGTIVDCYENPEGYAVDLAIPDPGMAGGLTYENVILRPDQFVVVSDAQANLPADVGDIGSDAEAESLRIRSLLMLEIENYIRDHGVSQVRASALLGIPPSGVEHLFSGDPDPFTADALICMLARLGIRLELTVHREDTRGMIQRQPGDQSPGDMLIKG